MIIDDNVIATVNWYRTLGTVERVQIMASVLSVHSTLCSKVLDAEEVRELMQDTFPEWVDFTKALDLTALVTVNFNFATGEFSSATEA